MSQDENDDWLQEQAIRFQVPLVNLSNLEIPEAVAKKVSGEMARMYRVVPIDYTDGVLTVAMADPRHVNALDDLRFILNCGVQGVCASEKQVCECIERLYGQP